MGDSMTWTQVIWMKVHQLNHWVTAAAYLIQVLNQGMIKINNKLLGHGHNGKWLMHNSNGVDYRSK